MRPQGGNRIEEEVPLVNWRKIFFLVVAAIVVWAAYAAIQATRRAANFEPGGPLQTAQAFVRQHLRYELMDEGLLYFRGPAETQIERLTGQRYLVTGTVDVIQADGQGVADHYSCTIRRLSNGDWAAEKIFVLPIS